MDETKLSWDARKAKQNLQKHKVSFEEAETVFYDGKAIEFFDPDHSKSEYRFLMLGISWRLRVIVVCHCLRKSPEIRIISARRATKKEEKVYVEGIR